MYDEKFQSIILKLKIVRFVIDDINTGCSFMIFEITGIAYEATFVDTKTGRVEFAPSL